MPEQKQKRINAGLRVAVQRGQTVIRPTPAQRLAAIAQILQAVDARCMAADGPVTLTRLEITDEELRRIYVFATESTFPLRGHT